MVQKKTGELARVLLNSTNITLISQNDSAYLRIRPLTLPPTHSTPTLGKPSRKRTFQAELGLLGEENEFQALSQNGLVCEDTDGIVFSCNHTTFQPFNPPTNNSRL